MDRYHAFRGGVFTDEAGRGLPYRLFVPAQSTEERGGAGPLLPLLLYLHGAGERGQDNHRHIDVHLGREGCAGGAFVAPEVQAEYPHVFLAPQCPRGSWWRGWGAEAAIALVQEIAETYPVDRDRLFITGISMGGYGTFYAIEHHPTLFAAAVPLSGGGDPSAAARLAHLPLWVFHGALDDVVPVSGSRDMVEAIRAAGGSPRYTEYPALAHDIWDRTYSDPTLLRWLFSQRRGRF